MQGIQSNIIPQKMEKRGLPSATSLISATNGPLEAAKRYLDRQRENEAALGAMDDDESGNQADDGRPEWLRRWQGEAPPHAAGMTFGRTMASGAGKSSANLDPETRSSDRSAVANGYTGQSIEAAFDFETVFHFETQLEAEETEDWLELSEERANTGESEKAQTLVDNVRNEHEREAKRNLSGDGQSDPSREREMNCGSSGQGEVGRSAERVSTIGVVPNPQAVRAAIFSLAQESTHRWDANEEPTEMPVSNGTMGVTIGDGIAEGGVAAEENATGSPRADFAEVARQLWSMQEPGDLVGHTCTSLAAERAVSDSDSKNAPDKLDSSEKDAERVEVGTNPEWTLNQALIEVRGETSEELRTETESKIGETEAVKKLSEPVSRLGASLKPRETHGSASDAPALAHDAGNLLAALKLYSELLALSGVLQARHSHYAQDLKLLAARSEVLIDRFLASCGLAERDARQLARDNGFDAEGRASLDWERSSGAERSTARPVEPGPSGSSQPPRVEEPDQSQRNSFAGKHGLASANSATVEAVSLGSPDLGGSESPTAGESETHQTGAEKRYAGWVDDPGKGRSGVAVMPSQDLAGSNRMTEEPSSARMDGVEANVPLGNDPINLVDLLTRWGSLLAMIARGPVEVKFGSQAAFPIEVSEEAMERILVNLVRNAMTATRDGGAIRIGVGRAETRRPVHSHSSSEGQPRPAGKMVLTVDDSGCGMSEEQIAKVLGLSHACADPRTEQITLPVTSIGRARDSRRHGMGLQIVRELVSSSGGELAIYSRRGTGTRIEIQWPILQRNAEQKAGVGRIATDSAGDKGANAAPVLRGQDRPPQTAPISSRTSDGFTHSRVRQGLEGAIAC